MEKMFRDRKSSLEDSPK